MYTDTVSLIMTNTDNNAKSYEKGIHLHTNCRSIRKENP